MYKLFIIGIIFLLGLYFIYCSKDIEPFVTNGSETYQIAENCSDVLIEKGSEFFLYNSKRANVPGVNPIRFSNLDEYTEFTEWQRSQGILCPILYLQHAYNVQGDSVYKVRPSPTNQHAGLPDYYITDEMLELASKNIMPPPIERAMHEESKLIDAGRKNSNDYNKNNYPGFDGHNQYIGKETPLDKMFNDTSNKFSANPMDSTWGGIDYTEQIMETGYKR
jgi:hypothetical protein